eukprot:CAMPEP_0173345248 /NCGR_PEP_ID=MMETSP1144-20121109/11873_1 /TAXON_ID=483371 /ORGANISM="non described non described, Strain CCMP2298" /LENGTH=43 /DNA_ID= /DNA_START= /DNA_END= /DNA_ORIENTATION=
MAHTGTADTGTADTGTADTGTAYTAPSSEPYALYSSAHSFDSF